jgi:hypothetical protein
MAGTTDGLFGRSLSVAADPNLLFARGFGVDDDSAGGGGGGAGIASRVTISVGIGIGLVLAFLFPIFGG